jgi:catechol 2,3-dioxygenase-like lactoylglutathione lyase family enzyme
MIRGLNHLTLAVADLERSFAFYAGLLGLRPRARWAEGAYLSAGELWLCLSVDPNTRAGALPEYTHVAFSVEAGDLPTMAQRLSEAGIKIWRENKSEGDSLYVLDPDGHKLELHVGDLASRLRACRQKPSAGMRLYDDD